MIAPMPPTTAETTSTLTPRVHRFEVRAKPGQTDPRADALARSAESLGLRAVAQTASVYLIEAPLTKDNLDRLASQLLADPVCEVAFQGVNPTPSKHSTIEVHPLPGVMDPAAQSVREAIADLLGIEADVSTGIRFDIDGLTKDQAIDLARATLANPVIHQITTAPFHPQSLPKGHAYSLNLRHVPIRDLSDEQLQSMSRQAHLFLSLDEMRAVQAEYRTLGREPTDIELETIAQTWSEHCVHKTLKSTVRYAGDLPTPQTGKPRPGHTINPDGTVTITNLLKSTIAAATHELIAEGVTWALSVFKDNSGVVALDDHWAVNIKVETHNRPSAIEPYGGAATGVGGCIRDVIATGLGAKPIANTDVFCVAHPTRAADTLPPGTIPPRRILSEVTAGVRDYGNRMGIPTVNGAVHFDDRYVGNPLVFCGCIGLLPRDRIKGAPTSGDHIIALGGRTGRDGIHGATFSSAELESNASTEFAHAVQIGNAIEEKRLLDAILTARSAGPNSTPLYSALTDCGAGGFSSAIGELGSTLGAQVHLDRAPLKYAGLSYTEIWISEAQERIILAVPSKNIDALRAICTDEGVEFADLGHFGTPDQDLILFYHTTEVGRLPMHFLHEGIPTPTREAVWPTPASPTKPISASPPAIADALLSLLAHPTIASKHWLIRQYDHEVQGNTIVKPLVGPSGRGPSDAAVLQPVPGSPAGIAIACGLQTPVGDPALGGDTYAMALAAIDECVRNLVCVGADPSRIAILDNFCWPSCEKPANLATLVRACEGCYDAAHAYRTPFVSGKDSLNNQLRFTDPNTGEKKVIEIPPTLLITGVGRLEDTSHAITMDAKRPGHVLALVGQTTPEMRASLFAERFGVHESWGPLANHIPSPNLRIGPATARAVHAMIAGQLVQSAHDCSEGGLLVALAEMLIATTGPDAPTPSLGADLLLGHGHASPHQLAFAESPSRYILEIHEDDVARARTIAEREPGVRFEILGVLTETGRLSWRDQHLDVDVRDLAKAWLNPLDW